MPFNYGYTHSRLETLLLGPCFRLLSDCGYEIVLVGHSLGVETNQFIPKHMFYLLLVTGSWARAFACCPAVGMRLFWWATRSARAWRPSSPPCCFHRCRRFAATASRLQRWRVESAYSPRYAWLASLWYCVSSLRVVVIAVNVDAAVVAATASRLRRWRVENACSPRYAWPASLWYCMSSLTSRSRSRSSRQRRRSSSCYGFATPAVAS